MNTAWTQALLDPQAPLPAGWRAWNGSDPRVRFDVHRNNVVSTLIDALAETFAVTQQLVGEAFFRTLARQFVCSRPPSSPLLWSYGADLPDFISSYEPAAGLPYLADVARLEHARVLAYHAADAAALTHDELARQLADPEALPQARLGLHPSLQVLRSAYAVVSIWSAHQAIAAAVDAPALPELLIDEPEAAWVMRAGDAVQVLPVEPEVALWIAALQRGRTLAQAMDDVAAPSLDLGAAFTTLISRGAICAWHAQRH